MLFSDSLHIAFILLAPFFIKLYISWYSFFTILLLIALVLLSFIFLKLKNSNSSIISWVDVIKVAPFLINLFVPFPCISSIS